jgi:hypothetical protein
MPSCSPVNGGAAAGLDGLPHMGRGAGKANVCYKDLGFLALHGAKCLLVRTLE